MHAKHMQVQVLQTSVGDGSYPMRVVTAASLAAEELRKKCRNWKCQSTNAATCASANCTHSQHTGNSNLEQLRKIARDTEMEKAELEEQVRLSNTEIETL